MRCAPHRRPTDSRRGRRATRFSTNASARCSPTCTARSRRTWRCFPSRCASCVTSSVHDPAEARACSARLRADLAGGLARLARVPEVSHGALVDPVAAPPVQHGIATMVEVLEPAGERAAHAAGCGRLLLLVQAHGLPMVAGPPAAAKGTMMRLGGRMDDLDFSQTGGGWKKPAPPPAQPQAPIYVAAIARAFFESVGKEETVPAGTVFFAENEKASRILLKRDKMYFLVDGEVALSAKGKSIAAVKVG